MAYPVPTDWTICGTLNKNGVPFSAGKVYADNLKDKAKVLEIRAMDERAKRTGNIIESMFYFSVPRNDSSLIGTWSPTDFTRFAIA